MNIGLNEKVIGAYRSSSQRARVLTEEWVHKQIYCPNCTNDRLEKYPNNRGGGDFFCGCCCEDFELKSKMGSFGKKIVDGEYQTLLERLADVHNPNLFLLNYDLASYQVSDFAIIPKHFFIPDIIERRKPLSAGARRAGWTGCNILLDKIPRFGRIFFIRDKQIEPKTRVRAVWRRTLFLREEKKAESKGWILDMMRCIELIRKREFTLEDVYKFEASLAQQHPNNRHVKDKIRQQLQVLRDRGFLLFLERGHYRLVYSEA